MAEIIPGRMTAQVEGDFVLFLIGMRINSFWKVWQWLPVVRAMGRMLGELDANPDLGLMHYRVHPSLRSVMLVQYWRSFDHLHAYATTESAEHLPAWRAFNRAVARTNDVGIWHETYPIRAGAYEAIYHAMPRYGLGLAGRTLPASGSLTSAKGRLGLSDGLDQPTWGEQ